MKQVILDSVCVENFRSFLQPAVIEFTRSNGLKFISGANRVEPALAANGAGKSTVFDAVCYALYGQSIKGLRASELRAYGSRSTAVLVLLLIDGETYWIQRTSPPERITVNDQPATQTEVDRLVGLSCDRFLSSVVYGQAVPLFIDLPKPQRGDLLDEVLNLEVWLRAAAKATERHNAQSADLHNLRILTARLEERLAAQPDVEALKAQETAWKSERDEQLRELTGQRATVEENIRQLEQRIQPVDNQSVVAAKALFDEHAAKLQVLREAQTTFGVERQRVENDIAFFHENDSCPTCNQPITQEFCDEHLARLTEDKRRYDEHCASIRGQIADATRVADDLGTAWQQAQHAVAGAEREQAVIAEQLRGERNQADVLKRQAVRYKGEKNPYSEPKRQAVAARRNISAELDLQRAAEDQAAKGLISVNYWRQGFRRVREYCLENVLRELALETRNSLLMLGLHEWNIYFVTAEQTQRGSMRFGVEVQIEPPDKPAGSFDVLSGGEGQRVRLAVSLGLASLVQRWAGVQWNFEVFDEPTAWLSEQGVEDLLDCLSYRAETQQKSVFICDHRALSHSGFAEQYLVTKDTDGSHWQRV